MERRPVLRIFISSTAVDLIDYRQKVRDAILRLKNLPIAMETFSAMPGRPAGECMKMAAEADAVVCVVAHRYGYIPPKEQGGDGERSITWLEVDAAKRAGKPVLAFLVDPNAPWPAIKEQDRLTSEPPEKATEIVNAVQKLREFKSYLQREHMRGMFKDQNELDAQVTAALANFTPPADHAPAATARIWKPLFCHALQRALNFRGRASRLQELKDWLATPVTPDRVISLVAAGGTGKTALVDQALHHATISDRAGVFVWSFYEEPNTDNFLREAYFYFTCEKDLPAAGMLERLQIALSGDLPHLLVLDGLERVQSEGDHRRRGELEDLQLKRLVRALAGGRGGTRALVTSRFPMVDLEQWTGAGHRAILLDDLERDIALEVLKAWKVKGDDAALSLAIEPLNTGGVYHALSVDVLGSYLGNFANGDSEKAPQFTLADAQEADPKARRLSHILDQYAKALTPQERDLLARLSLFPRGVEIRLLGWIVQSGGEVAGALIGLSEQKLATHLERLKNLGLVFRYETNKRIVYSAHPFLRDFFRNLLGVNTESIHESVRTKLAPSLEARPAEQPSDPTILDQYEFLIEQTLLAGQSQEAFDLYWHGVGNSENLEKTLGENARGLRILERFFPKDDFFTPDMLLSSKNRSVIANELGMFASNLGDLRRAGAAYAHSRQLNAKASDPKSESAAIQNLVNIEILAGCFPQGLEYANNAAELAQQSEDQFVTITALSSRATTYFCFGNRVAAISDFQRATDLEGQPLCSLRGVREAESKLLLGDRFGALTQTEANREFTIRNKWNSNLCRCNALLVRLVLPEDSNQANKYLQEARAFANWSGDVELQLLCFQSACKLYRHRGDHPQAIAEAEAGVMLADACGFGQFSIDLRLALAETLLDASDARRTLKNARWALDRSEQPDCQYAWGQADGLHFCGLAHLRLGEHELARQRLTVALELRERIGHGRIDETRRALEMCNE